MAYKAPIIVNGLFEEQSETDKEAIKECWGDDEKADDANKIYVKFLEEVKQEVKKRLSEEFTEISDYIEKEVVENLKYVELLSLNLTNTSLTNISIDYDHKQEMRKKYKIEVKGSEISI